MVNSLRSTELSVPSSLTCLDVLWGSVCDLAGDIPPVVTEPTVILGRVNSLVKVQVAAQDPNGDTISFSLIYPGPPGASIGSG